MTNKQVPGSVTYVCPDCVACLPGASPRYERSSVAPSGARQSTASARRGTGGWRTTLNAAPATISTNATPRRCRLRGATGRRAAAD